MRRIVPWFAIVAFSLPLWSAVGSLAPAADAGPEVTLDVTLEGNAKAPLELVLEDTYSKPLKTWKDLDPGELTLELPTLENDHYLLKLTAPGYALQHLSLDVTPQGVVVSPNSLEMYRRRYVVLRYVVNTVGERDFKGPNIKEGRAAISYTDAPDLHGDWWIRQNKDAPAFCFHRTSSANGFARPDANVSFDDIAQAPEPDQYRPEKMVAEKGLILLNRIEGDGPEWSRYAKILVEDVTETPPQDIPVIDSPQRPTRFPRAAASDSAGPSQRDSSGELTLNIRLEDDAHAPINFELRDYAGKQLKTWGPEESGDVALRLPGLDRDRFLVIVSAQGYSPVRFSFRVSATGIERTAKPVVLYRTRYMVLRYAINTAGERNLTGDNVKQGRVVVTAGRVVDLNDWSVAQQNGNMHAVVHRAFTNTGFVRAPEGVAFDELAEAPPREEYHPDSFDFEKGMVLFNRVVGGRPEDARYAKLMVEDVTETRPENVENADRERPLNTDR